jgi:hypothetical protein
MTPERFDETCTSASAPDQLRAQEEYVLAVQAVAEAHRQFRGEMMAIAKPSS